VLALLAFSLTACLDEEPTSVQSGPQPTYSVVDIADEEVFEDSPMIEIARAMPAFGGFYYVEGRLEVALTDLSRRPEAEQRIRALMPESSRDRVTFTARTVQYSFFELARYRTALRRTIFEIPGVRHCQRIICT
jgi:hypothetical protein